jgi:uncharacterized protein
MTYALYLVIGLLAGVLSGCFGVGGGSLMIPALVLLFGFTQHQAQGTSLAVMLPPVFILAVWRYHQAGQVNVVAAILIAVGLTIGALVGANFVQTVPDAKLTKAFGIFLAIVAVKMIFGK